jgi:hypothetical protein
MPRNVSRAAALAVALILPWRPVGVRAQDAAAALLAAERGLAETSDRVGLARALVKGLPADAVLVWPGAPVAVGPDAARLLAAQTALDSLRLSWQPLGLELSADSSLGITWGVAIATPRAAPAAPAAPRTGCYIHAWRRDGGRWSIAALLLSGALPPGKTVVPAGMLVHRTRLTPGGAVGPFVGADLAFARLAGDSGAGVAFARWAAPEAVMVDGSGLLVRGPDAVGALVAGPAAWRWHPVAGGAAVSGELGWTVGEAVIAPPDAGPIYSKYLTVWRRLPDGTIRFLTDGGNERPAP